MIIPYLYFFNKNTKPTHSCPKTKPLLIHRLNLLKCSMYGDTQSETRLKRLSSSSSMLMHATSVMFSSLRSYGQQPRGFYVHGILQARILEYSPVPSSKGSSQPRDLPCLWHLPHWQASSLPLASPRKPQHVNILLQKDLSSINISFCI